MHELAIERLLCPERSRWIGDDSICTTAVRKIERVLSRADIAGIDASLLKGFEMPN
jgi:hypothetical protein